MRYADNTPGDGANATQPVPEQGDRSEGQPRLLCREPGGRWSLRYTGAGPAVHISPPIDDLIEATNWADDLIGTGSGTWAAVDNGGPHYHQEGDRWVPNEGPVYRWQPGAGHITRVPSQP